MCIRDRPALNMEPDGAGRIIVQQTGDYEVSYHVQISANNPVTMALAVRSNEAMLPQTESTWAVSYTHLDVYKRQRIAMSITLCSMGKDIWK